MRLRVRTEAHETRGLHRGEVVATHQREGTVRGHGPSIERTGQVVDGLVTRAGAELLERQHHAGVGGLVGRRVRQREHAQAQRAGVDRRRLRALEQAVHAIGPQWALGPDVVGDHEDGGRHAVALEDGQRALPVVEEPIVECDGAGVARQRARGPAGERLVQGQHVHRARQPGDLALERRSGQLVPAERRQGLLDHAVVHDDA